MRGGTSAQAAAQAAATTISRAVATAIASATAKVTTSGEQALMTMSHAIPIRALCCCRYFTALLLQTHPCLIHCFMRITEYIQCTVSTPCEWSKFGVQVKAPLGVLMRRQHPVPSLLLQQRPLLQLLQKHPTVSLHSSTATSLVLQCSDTHVFCSSV